MRVTKGTFKSWNEGMIKKYDPDLFHSHPNRIIRYIERKRVRLILHYLNPRAKDGILEVGCGAGNILEKITGGSLLVGIDISEFILQKAGNRLKNRTTLLKADAENLPFKDGSFNKIYCSEVLEHLLRPERVVKEISRILKSEGLFILSVPNEDLINFCKQLLIQWGLFRIFFKSKKGYKNMPERMDDEWHLNRFNRDILSKTLKGLFRIKKIRGVPASYFPLRYVVMCEPVK